jgi:hypothetical protein
MYINESPNFTEVRFVKSSLVVVASSFNNQHTKYVRHRTNDLSGVAVTKPDKTKNYITPYYRIRGIKI